MACLGLFVLYTKTAAKSNLLCKITILSFIYSISLLNLDKREYLLLKGNCLHRLEEVRLPAMAEHGCKIIPEVRCASGLLLQDFAAEADYIRILFCEW